MRSLSLVLACAMIAGCAGRAPQTPSVDVAASVSPLDLETASQFGQIGGDYRIGAADKLRISVFQVPDLSFESVVVDASGNLQMPLIGSLRAAGRTPLELASDIQDRLRGQYLKRPQVTISVTDAASQKVTVDGAVSKPGVYEIRGRITLLQAVAMAEGPTRVANLSSVALFRTVDDRRMVALYDLGKIRAGQLDDPLISGDDIIIVDTSRLSAAMRDIIQALPGLGVFTYL